jgi:hypothetical protein
MPSSPRCASCFAAGLQRRVQQQHNAEGRIENAKGFTDKMRESKW